MDSDLRSLIRALSTLSLEEKTTLFQDLGFWLLPLPEKEKYLEISKQCLPELMRKISRNVFWAPPDEWHNNLEFILWGYLCLKDSHNELRSGITLQELDDLKQLSEMADGWWGYTLLEGEKFFSRKEFSQFYQKWRAERK